MLSERELEAALRRVEPPGADAAAERAWRDVQAALDAPAPRRTFRWGWRRAVPALAAVLLGLAVALTPPGEAVAEWLRRAVEPAARAPAPPAIPVDRFPGGGALLVRSGDGLSIVDEAGQRRRLGRWDDAAWSPHGRFVVAVRGQELAALDRRGGVRWRLRRPYPLAQPAWSPDGQRIAYRSLDGLRVVAGDGTGDRLLAGPLGPAGPAWRPGATWQLAWADREGRVRLVDAETGRTLWRSAAGAPVEAFAWAPGGRRLAVVTAGGLRVLDSRGRSVSRIRLAAGRTVVAAAFQRRGRAPLAYAVHDLRRRRTVVRMAPGRLLGGRPSVVPRDHASSRLFTGRGRIADLAFAPDGDWLLLGWRGADQWVLLGAPYVTGVAALRDVSRRFGPRPRVRGWCCPP